jgi:Mn-dependent DtxR family transcriptional regulator
MARDRVGADDFILTQEFLSIMLAVRRPSVTVAVGSLQRAGLIRYRHGHVTILDPDGLEDASCECFRQIKKEQEQLLCLQQDEVIGAPPLRAKSLG